jgi:hypothetical protein
MHNCVVICAHFNRTCVWAYTTYRKFSVLNKEVILKDKEYWLLVFKNSTRRVFLAVGTNVKLFLARRKKMLGQTWSIWTKPDETITMKIVAESLCIKTSTHEKVSKRIIKKAMLIIGRKIQRRKCYSRKQERQRYIQAIPLQLVF